jgi:hypothetical protein
MSDSATSPLHERILAAIGRRSIREVAELTRHHPETVRRYLSGQSPSVEFVAALCVALRLNAQWVLTGRGPMLSDDIRTEALRGADTGELLGAFATTVEAVQSRLERVEVYMQTMEARLRAVATTAEDRVTPTPGQSHADRPARASLLEELLRDAVPERPPPSAG